MAARDACLMTFASKGAPCGPDRRCHVREKIALRGRRDSGNERPPGTTTPILYGATRRGALCWKCGSSTERRTRGRVAAQRAPIRIQRTQRKRKRGSAFSSNVSAAAEGNDRFDPMFGRDPVGRTSQSWSVAPMCPAFLLGANTDRLHAMRKVDARTLGTLYFLTNTVTLQGPQA